MKLLILLSSTIAVARGMPQSSRSKRDFSQDCAGSDLMRSGISIRYIVEGDKLEARKQKAITILNWYKNWSNDFSSRQAFKAENGDVVGYMWVGSMIQNSGLSKNISPDFIEEIKVHGMPEEIYYEFIHENAMKSFGIISTTKGLASAQAAVQSWSMGTKVARQAKHKSSQGLSICFLPYRYRKQEANDHEAGPCKVHKLKEGRPPGGNVGEYLHAFNKHLDFSKLPAGTPYCYSVGKPPDYRPQKKSNGDCATHLIRSDNTCGGIAAKYSPSTTEEIEKFNKNTYGWKGCSSLQLLQLMCVSEGRPPKPVSNPKAECGPLAPGDSYNKDCSNKACCSDHGFCGLTSEFCDVKNPKGAPGTRGCYSNCGYGTLPKRKANGFKRIAYWLDSDGAMYYDVSKITGFDTVHYAFATINEDLSIGVGHGFEKFKKIKAKKVISFGGWELSTEPSTYHLLREAVSDRKRSKFARIVVAFLQQNQLDGVDFDWEYPEAPDIPNIPAGIKGDGDRYADLLKQIKEMDRSKTVSVAIPASYWYLKGFPLAKFDASVDYFVFMNYDYSGQWDYGKLGTGIGCHSDRSMTEAAIKMLVKSGIDTTKVYGGLANYGRSFRSADKNCKQYKCLFTGPKATTAAGEITNTPGFLSIGEINKSKFSETSFNETSKCFYGIYNQGRDWVAWMKESDIRFTEDWYRNTVGLGGSILWVYNYYKTEKSDSPDTLNCYFQNGRIKCDGIHVKVFDDMSHRRDNKDKRSFKNSLHDAFGPLYARMERVKRLLAYIVKLVDVRNLKGRFADLFRATYLCAQNVHREIENVSWNDRPHLLTLLEALAYLFTSDTWTQATTEYRDALNLLNNSRSLLPQSETVCSSNVTNYVLTYASQYTVAQASMYDEMIATDSSAYSTITAMPTSNSVVDDDHITFGEPSYNRFGRSVNAQVRADVSDNDEDDQNYQPEVIVDNAEYLETAFQPFPSGPVQYESYRLCSIANPRNFHECTVQSRSMIFNPAYAEARVGIGNSMRELGTSDAPLYVLNMAGNSPGAACNALLFFLSKTGQAQIMKSGSPFSTRGHGRGITSWSSHFPTCIGMQKDEFPPASTKEGKAFRDKKLHFTARVSCINETENTAEGSNLLRFYLGVPENSKKGTLVCEVDWSGKVPKIVKPSNDGGDRKRTKPQPTKTRRDDIKANDKFYVLVNIDSNVDCSEHMKIPKKKVNGEYLPYDNDSGIFVATSSIDHDEL